MDQFFSMNQFRQTVEQALALGEAYQETHDESLLEAEIAAWQYLLPKPIFRQTRQDLQVVN